MKDILTVLKFTMKEMVKRKSFIISTLIILVFIVVGFNVPNIIKKFTMDTNRTFELYMQKCCLTSNYMLQSAVGNKYA